MGFGVGLLLTAAGAILAWAVNAPSSTVNVHAVGYVLLAVGLIGMSVSLAFWNSWAGPGNFVRGRRTVIDDAGVRSTEERTTTAY